MANFGLNFEGRQQCFLCINSPMPPARTTALLRGALLASAWFLHFLTVASTAAAQQPASAEQAFCQGHPDRPRKGERIVVGADSH